MKDKKTIYREWQRGAEHQHKRGPMSAADHEQHARDVAARHGITLLQLAAIVTEGLKRNW